MVSHVLNRMHALARLGGLICLPVRDSPGTRQWSASSGVLCMLYHTSSHGGGGDEWCLMWYLESLEKPRCHNDDGCAAVDNSPYALPLATSVRYCTLWTMFAESSVSVPFRYWHIILALGLWRTTDDSGEIWWGRTSSRVAISACAANFCFCWLSVAGSSALDLSIATLSSLKLQSETIHMGAELRLSILLVLWDNHSHWSRRSRHSRCAEVRGSETVNALHAAQCVAAIRSLQSRESFSFSMSFNRRVSSPLVHFAHADFRGSMSASIIECLLHKCTSFVPDPLP